MLEPEAFGGQAGTSSMIRNYLGFPRGISGTELAERAYYQATGFGAEIVYGQRAVGVHSAGSDRLVTLGDGTQVASRAVILATGGDLAKPGGAQPGGAGQAAVHLASYAAQVTLLVGRSTLTETMSDYRVKELQATPNIRVRYNTEAVDGHGEGRLTGLTLKDGRHPPGP